MTGSMQIYGAWQDTPEAGARTNVMTLDAAQLAAHWRRCSLSSDFWAHYTALFVPAVPQPGMLRREDVENILSYLLNELFENCAKFSSGPLMPVRYQSWISPTSMVFQMTNYIEPAAQAPFVTLIQEILEGDPDELYFQRLEANAESDSGGSGLGYLTLIKDYGVRFGFRFQPVSNDSVAVDVQAHISTKEE